VKKTRQIKKLERVCDSIKTGCALEQKRECFSFNPAMLPSGNPDGGKPIMADLIGTPLAFKQTCLNR
jgi:hypothetical protein